MKNTSKFRKDLPQLYPQIKKKLISKLQIAKDYKISHTIVGKIVDKYEQDLELKYNELELQKTATNMKKDSINDYLAKELAKKLAPIEFLKHISSLYNKDHHNKEDSIRMTQQRFDFLELFEKNFDKETMRILFR